jgi:hypothetical protein
MPGATESRTLAAAVNIFVRAALAFFCVDALRVTTSDPADARYAGKGIAVRNALVMAGFCSIVPALFMAGRRKTGYPWIGDALLLSVPALDMVGNWLNLYNRYGLFDTIAHWYGTAATSGLLTLAMAGRAREPRLVRWLVAAGTTTLFHLLLEAQEYWTDVFCGTHNVEGIEDVEGDLGAGVVGAFCGVVAAELALNGLQERAAVVAEAARMGPILDPLLGGSPRASGVL